MPGHGPPKFFAYGFERMAEHAMPNVVKKRRGQSIFCLTFFELLTVLPNISTDNPHQKAGSVKYPDAVSEARMCRAGKHKFRKTQLPNTPQPLELRRLNNPPKGTLELFGVEFNKIMNRISYALRFTDRHEIPVASSQTRLINQHNLWLSNRQPPDRCFLQPESKLDSIEA
jgi:hypothetical protein